MIFIKLILQIAISCSYMISLNFINEPFINIIKIILPLLSNSISTESLIVRIEYHSVILELAIGRSIITHLWQILVELSKFRKSIIIDNWVNISSYPSHASGSHNVWNILIHKGLPYRTIYSINLILVKNLILLLVKLHCWGWLSYE